MAVLRAGLIGFGAMGRHHARVLRSLPGVELVGVVDPAAAPESADPAEPLATVEELLAARVDYCVVATPTSTHEALGTLLASCGVPTLIEKPLAMDVAAAEALALAFENAGVVGAVGHIERFNPALAEARRRLASAELGEVHQVVTRRQSQFPTRVSDVGVVMDLATHDLDLTTWMTGQSYASVAAQVAHRSGREHEDLVGIVGRLDGGIVTSHLVNWLSPFKERTTVVTGDRGALVVDTLTADLTVHLNGSGGEPWEGVAAFRGVSEGDVTRVAIAKPEPLRLEHEAFRDAVLGLPSDAVSMRDGLAAVRVAQAVLDSAAAGRTVNL